MFDEHSGIAQDLMSFFETCLVCATDNCEISYKISVHDIARKMLNEVVEFKQKEE
jgi:hypothetical protein